MKRTTYLLLSLSMIAMGITSCEENEFQNGLKIGDVSQILASNGDIGRSAYSRANGDGSLTDVLSGGSLTAFLPIDEAYKKAGYINTESVAEADPALLKEIILYHVIQGGKKAGEFTSGDVATLATGKNISIATGGTQITIYGVGNDGQVATLVGTDSRAANGFVHTIDELLLPAERNLATITIDNGYFDIFEAAMTRADFTATLQGAGPFTVFAPGDAAFISYLGIPTKDASNKDRAYSAIQNDAIAAINAKTPAELADLLKYHVVDGSIGSHDFTAGALMTLNGKNVTIAVEKGVLKSITGIANTTASSPLQADVAGINGVVHIIDRVLKP
jgi:transforming growth factor-beta-induced protein